MIELIKGMFSFNFMVRAILVGVPVALCAALLGVSLVLKRYSMIGDGLSHFGFGVLSVAVALNLAPLAFSIPIMILAAFALLRIRESSKIKGDAATAIISTGSLAVGIMAISLSTGINADVYSYMFGSILAMSKGDVWLSLCLSSLVLILFIVCYNRIFAITFDEAFAQATGTRTNLYNFLIAISTAITIVLGMRMIGTLLISALIVFPALSAMRICKRFKNVVICAAVISVICLLSGLVISYALATPTGASIVVVNIIFFIAFSLAGFIKSRVN
ncbi:MAG: metal ABC transporter permease [Clostridiales bacterium]|jgi:ABC-type Mn2+/Zn2+ transport system permease subunit|nr:metal ABC transporter permease [Clostridiales bacterium]